MSQSTNECESFFLTGTDSNVDIVKQCTKGSRRHANDSYGFSLCCVHRLAKILSKSRIQHSLRRSFCEVHLMHVEKTLCNEGNKENSFMSKS